MSRKPTPFPTRKLEITLPESLLLEIEVYLPRNTLTGKVLHGAWSLYFTTLLRRDLETKARNMTAQSSLKGEPHAN